ncbi:hypothetical protein FSP39_006747 [Pinctada imbricata]|uniref:THD domain-containing protein n=1 Tax=Pinctada imbricata TaxID=66713 RepID=A0AA88XZ54_PINIB|nr:hypothetical protein FSP39_006747 [Pinctada imbricata]
MHEHYSCRGNSDEIAILKLQLENLERRLQSRNVDLGKPTSRGSAVVSKAKMNPPELVQKSLLEDRIFRYRRSYRQDRSKRKRNKKKIRMVHIEGSLLTGDDHITNGTYSKWQYADWFQKLHDHELKFKLNYSNGELTVRDGGLYLLYAQVDRSRRRRHRRDRRSLRNRLFGAILKQVVHLRGSTEVNSQATRNPVHGVSGCGGSGCFRWSNPDYIYTTNFDYVRDHSLNKVVGIKISSPGVYLIYSQVGVNGPRQRTDPSVGYETVKTDSSGRTIVLMRTFITQDERGRRDGMFSPHDSINQFGVFKLHCDDTVIVRQDTPAGNNPPDFIFDDEQSFFGIVQINPTNGALDGNYDCNAP